MRRITLSAFLTGSFTLAGTTLLQAADLSATEPVVEAPEPVYEKSGPDLYIAGRLGAAFQDDTSFRLNSAAAVPTSVGNQYEDIGLFGALAVGTNIFDNIRGEVELSGSSQSIESHTLTAVPATVSGGSAFGDTRTFTTLVNGYYDIDLGSGFGMYTGAGVGWSWVEFDNHGITVPAGGLAGLPAGNLTAMSDTGNGLTWQVGAGVNYAFSDTTTLELGYRYQAVEGVGLTASDGTQTDVDLDSHNILAGVRFKLN